MGKNETENIEFEKHIFYLAWTQKTLAHHEIERGHNIYRTFMKMGPKKVLIVLIMNHWRRIMSSLRQMLRMRAVSVAASWSAVVTGGTSPKRLELASFPMLRFSTIS